MLRSPPLGLHPHHVWSEDFWNRHRSVLARIHGKFGKHCVRCACSCASARLLVLESLQDRDDHPRNGTRRSVQRVGKLKVSLRPGLVQGPQTVETQTLNPKPPSASRVCAQMTPEQPGKGGTRGIIMLASGATAKSLLVVLLLVSDVQPPRLHITKSLLVGSWVVLSRVIHKKYTRSYNILYSDLIWGTCNFTWNYPGCFKKVIRNAQFRRLCGA